MRVIQVVKKLNNTELGKTGIHEKYVYIPQDLEINDLFPDVDADNSFVFKKNEKVYHIRYQIGREKRIVGFGEFYRDNDVCAGDEVVLERHIDKNGKQAFYIDLNKRRDILTINRFKDGFELLNAERKSLVTSDVKAYFGGEMKPITIDFIRTEKKRKDSQYTTDIYDVRVDGESIVKKYAGKDMIEIQVDSTMNRAYINKFCAWKKYSFEMEDQDD